MNWFRALLRALAGNAAPALPAPPAPPPARPAPPAPPAYDYDRAALVRELSRDEGRRNQIYLDTVGKWSGGVGRNLTDKGFSEDEIDLMLANDIAEAADSLDRVFPMWRTDLSERRRRLLLNFVFNLGESRAREFKKMWAALQLHNYEEAAKEMRDSKWAGQVGVRADRLIEMMEQG